MKTLIGKAAILLTLFVACYAFAPKPGGEGFEIYLNEKVFTQQFGKNIDEVKSLQLGQTASTDQLVIKYHHCGQVGKNRVVMIKDGQNKVLKEFRYKDGTSSVSSMSVPVKDLAGLKAQNMKLVYTSTELPNGRVLLLIKPTSGNLVKL